LAVSSPALTSWDVLTSREETGTRAVSFLHRPSMAQGCLTPHESQGTAGRVSQEGRAQRPYFTRMSDQAPNRPEVTPASGSDHGANDSQLRLFSADGNFVFPQGAEAADDSPTIISKIKPGDGAQTPALAGSLRGRKLAHFELLEPIGVGGMAAVMRARDTQLERVVALKILPPDMAQDEENVRRFHQEARAAAKLDHENIARVYFCGEDQGLHFIAFEFVEGVNLRMLLEERDRKSTRLNSSHP
jgi:serine/threonine protein kinase